MTDRKALFQAILDAPDDDAPRLVYADWLDEHGNEDDRARAEFIRLQCEAQQLDEDDPRRELVLVRVAELLPRYEADWRKEVPQWARAYCTFRRGFVDEVTTTVATWLRGAAGLVRGTPLRSVTLRGAAGRLEALLASRHLARLRSLNLLDEDMDIGDLRALTTSPHVGALTELKVTGRDWFAEGAQVLAEWPGFARLRLLTVVSASLGDPGCLVLAQASAATGLVELNLMSCGIGRDGYRAIAESPHLQGLRVLGLHNNTPWHDGIAALLTSPLAANLESLQLSANDILAAWLPPLSGLVNLRKLWLRQNRLRDSGAEALAAAPPPRLQYLYLSGNEIGNRGGRALAASPHLGGLRRLELRDNFIFDGEALRQRFGDRVEL